MRTQKEYNACVQQANSEFAHDKLVARGEQAAGGLLILGGVATVWVTGPAIAEGYSETPAGGDAFEIFVESTHTVPMAYAITTAPVYLPGALYLKGIFDQAQAEDNYNYHLISCAGPVTVP